jgi:mRNA interferase RelE/StbE
MASSRYTVWVQPGVIRTLRQLPREIARRVDAVLLELETEPRPPGVKKLAVRGGWRLRLGDYRILYVIDDKARTVAVYRVGHRKDVDRDPR